MDLDDHTRLVVEVSRERLGLLGEDSGITLDEGGHDTTAVSIPSNGAISRSTKSGVFLDVFPERMAAWATAP